VSALACARAPTANDLFKRQYAETLRWSVIGALTVVVVAALVVPEYRPTPYRLRQEEIRVVEIELEAPPVAPLNEQPAPPPLLTVVPVAELDPGAPEVTEYEKLIAIPTGAGSWTEPAPPEPFVASSRTPRLVRSAPADYPEMARLAGLQGTVIVKVLVDVDGTVTRVELLKGVHPLVDRPALAAARRLVFEPGTQREQPVPCWVAVPYRFSLR